MIPKSKPAIVNKPESKAHGKRVYVWSRRGRKYRCSFTDDVMADEYTFWRNELKFEEDESESS